MALVECQQLYKEYQEKTGGKKTDVIVTPVLKGINLKIEQGEQVAILGHSGSGKSTLLHLLAMLDTPCEGSISIDGKDVKQMSENDKAEFRNENMGFIYQFHHLLMEFDALENVMMPLLIQNVDSNEAKKKAEELLKAVGLEHRMSHKPAQMSGGERQRVAIARALVNQPKLVLADEPTGNLDKANSEQVFQLFLKLNKEFGTSLVVVTHDLELASRFDRIIRLDDGKVVERAE
jgi:lipoprotein-releasing system ATP-binding protein